MISSADVTSFTPLLNAHRAVHTFLSASSREDSMFASADDLSTILWTQELQAAIDRSGSVIAKLAAEKDEEAQMTREKLVAVHEALKGAAEKLWKGDEDVFGVA